MIELKINIESINYSNVIEQILPQVIEKMEEQSDGGLAVAVLSKLKGVSPAMLKTSLSFLPQEVKDELAIACLEHYKEEVREVINNFANDKNIDIVVGEIVAEKK